jgi:hypothetical protein
MKYKMGVIIVLKLEPYHGDKKYITERIPTPTLPCLITPLLSRYGSKNIKLLADSSYEGFELTVPAFNLKNGKKTLPLIWQH